jgi:hypothetical protein
MEGIGTLIAACFLFTFGPPVILLIVALVKRIRNKDSAKIFFILGLTWLIIGGGICASILT